MARDHRLARIESERQDGYCLDPECCPPGQIIVAVCTCGWRSEANTLPGDAEWDYDQHESEEAQDGE